MPIVTSTLQIDLVDDVSKNAKAVAAALEKAQKQTLALEAALAKSGVSDKLQANLKKIGASASHVQGVSLAWKDYVKQQGLAGKAAIDFTKVDIAAMKSWEGVTLSALRAVKSEEATLARVRAQQAAQAVHEAEQATQARIRAMDRERAATQRLVERERARTDNTIAGIAALYAAHSAAHAAVSVGERYREFDKERRYAKVVMGISDQQQEPLVRQAIKGGASTKFNDVQWLESQRELASRGYNLDQVRAFAPIAAQLGQAFDVSMPEGVKAFEGAMLGFKKDVSTYEKAQASARRTADLEVKASKISGMNHDDIVQLYKRGASAAQISHLSEENLLAFGAIAKKANIGGDEASTSFVALSKNLMTPTHEARTAMQAAGIDFSKYQKIGDINEAGFASEVARNYGVKLSAHVRNGLHRIFTDPKVVGDPSQFTPAVTRFLRTGLGGKDAKSLKSIAGLAGRYRDDSATGVDTQGLLAALMTAMQKNPALANAIFGSKQGGRIFTALGDKELFAHMMDQLLNHSQGMAQKVSDERMSGFDGAVSKFQGSIANLETAIGRAFDDNGRGGFLTNATLAASAFANILTDANPHILRAGSEAVLLAGAFAALKSVDFLKGGFGLKTSAVALDHSAGLLDQAALRLGASKTAETAAVAGGAAEAAAAAAPKTGFLGGGGFKGLAEGLSKGAMGYIIYEAGAGAIEATINALPKPKYPEGYDPEAMKNRGLVGDAKAVWNDFFGPRDAVPLAGKRASGGAVGRGQSYLVGERGPEIFTPGLSGGITSNTMLAALSKTNEGGKTADEVRFMARELANAVDGIARAVAGLKDGRVAGDYGDGYGDGKGGTGGGRRGFMRHNMMLSSSDARRPIEAHDRLGGVYLGGRRGFMRHGLDPMGRISASDARRYVEDHDRRSGVLRVKAVAGHPLVHPREFPGMHPQLRGGADRPATLASNPEVTTEGRALLDTIASSEANHDPAGGYNSRYPGKTFNNGYVDHPRIRERILNGPNAGSTSDAAGRYQFLSRIWDEQARTLGLQDFGPANQDKAAWHLAQENYRHRTGRDLQHDLQSGDQQMIARVGKVLHGTWTSLPGGIEQGQNAKVMVDRFRRNLERQQQRPRQYDTEQPPFAETDDPLGLRRRRAGTAVSPHRALQDEMQRINDLGISPDIDHDGLHQYIKTIRTARTELEALHKTGGGQRGSGKQIAGLGSRLRGGFSHSGSEFG